MSNYQNELDLSELEVEIFNSKNRLIEWHFEELKIHQEPQIKIAIRNNYRKIPINV
ncbi:MAG: hypothetical protein ACFFDF_08055 [Candidatus Odinarchaeota archaeon]